MSNLSQQKVAFIGLGVMGFPMAGHLQQKGEQVCVYNRTHQKALDWVQHYGGTCASTPAEAAAGADLVMLCVGNDDDVRSVVYGELGVLAVMQPGSLLIDPTTASADLARELPFACKAKAICYYSRAYKRISQINRTKTNFKAQHLFKLFNFLIL